MITMLARERSKKSYYKNKIKVARRRILNAIDKGRCVHEKTLTDPKYEWNEAEKAMLEKCLQNRRDRYLKDVSKITDIRDKRFRYPYPSENIRELHRQELAKLIELEKRLKRHKKMLKKLKNNKDSDVYKFISVEIENIEKSITEFRVKTTQNKKFVSKLPYNIESKPQDVKPDPPPQSTTLFRKITAEDVKKVYEEIFKKNILKNTQKNRNRIYKIIDNMFKQVTDDLFLVYQDPKKYEDKLKNKKDFLNIIYRVYNFTTTYYNEVDIPDSVRQLNMVVYESVFTILFNRIQSGNKEREISRMYNEPYYDWEDIKKIPDIIVESKNVRNMMDKILVLIYVEENVLRDDLGNVEIRNKYCANCKVNYIMRNSFVKQDDNRYIIYLNDYKTAAYRGEYRVTLSNKVSKLIDEYFNLRKIDFSGNTQYLFVNDKGHKYANGKLSSYIISMFKRHTGAVNLGINQLRHSVATYFKDASKEAKEQLAVKMQHSFDQHIRYERYSGIKIKIPIFSESEIEDNPLVGETVKVYNKQTGDVDQGVVRLSGEKYTVFFSNGKKKTYEEGDIIALVEENRIMSNIGKEVRYDGKAGIIGFNPEYANDYSDLPYMVYYENEESSEAFALPSSKITYVR